MITLIKLTESNQQQVNIGQQSNPIIPKFKQTLNINQNKAVPNNPTPGNINKTVNYDTSKYVNK